jgi:serpin B
MSRSILLRGLAAASALALASAACGSTVEPAPGGGGGVGTGGAPGAFAELRSAAAHVAPNVADADRATYVADGRAFTFDLYRKVADAPESAGKSVWMSPLSVAYALSMTSAGAKGATLDEMRAALRVHLPQPTLHEANNWLAAELAARPAKALATAHPGEGDLKMDLSLVDQLFAQTGFEAVPAFLDVLASQYDAGVKLTDFGANADASRQAINDWVAAQTSHRIEGLLPPGSVDESVRFVLVNAVSLGAPWDLPFSEELTKDAPFTRLDGSTVTAKLMHTYDAPALPYVAADDYEACAIPLRGRELEVVVVLPKAGKLASVDAALDGASFGALRDAMKPKELAVALPKMRFTSPSISLVPALRALGMKLAFEDAADFSGLSTSTHVVLFDVLHKAMVGLDEHGIEAAAATAVIGGDTAAGPEPQPFVVDRPFLLGIRDATTGALLFWGRLVEPG